MQPMSAYELAETAKKMEIEKNLGYEAGKAIDTVKELPQQFELDELMEKLVFVEKVEKALLQAEEGKVTPHDKVREITKKW